eukprot:554323_1
MSLLTFIHLTLLLLFVKCDNKISGVIKMQELEEMGIETIIVIGDIHGAYITLLEFAISNNICNKDGIWIAFNTILIFIGDLIHRGPASFEVINKIMEWQTTTKQYNSEIFVLRGNHEQFELRYAHRHVLYTDEKIENLEGLAKHPSLQFHQR